MFHRAKENRFFIENVGMSAWGLAIHERSRLIAVSSNLRQVTVFIPAITSSRGETLEYSQRIFFPEVSESFPRTASFRVHNSRRVLRLGSEGHNIPSVDFVSDDDGEACSVLAIDIRGVCSPALLPSSGSQSKRTLLNELQTMNTNPYRNI